MDDRMNYELFNDAMCRLRQAEENMNVALRDVYVAINMADKGPMYGPEIHDNEEDDGK